MTELTRLNIDGQHLISTHTEVSFTFSILIDNKHRSFGWLALLVSDKPIVRWCQTSRQIVVTPFKSVICITLKWIMLLKVVNVVFLSMLTPPLTNSPFHHRMSNIPETLCPQTPWLRFLNHIYNIKTNVYQH